MSTFSFDDLNKRYQDLTGIVQCDCTFATELVGGQPASEAGVRAFVEYHLHLAGDEAQAAVQRILHEEVGEKTLPPEEGELKEKAIYGVNAIRRTSYGPYLGSWMIKACFKQAASRLNVFTERRGSKGDFSEAGQVLAWGPSLVHPDHPAEIYLLSPDSTPPATTEWHEFMGKVNTPAGSKSIIHHSECVPPGTRFSWEMRFLSGRVNEEDVRDVLALMMVVGLGSARSLERGKFKIDRAEIGLKKHMPRKLPAPRKGSTTPTSTPWHTLETPKRAIPRSVHDQG